MKPQLFIFLLAGLSLISCRQTESDSDNRYSEERPLSGVSRLHINGVFNLYLTQSENESLTINGSSELAEKLKVSQEGDLLILEMEEFSTGFFDKKELRVDLAISNLEEFKFEGVGNIQSTGPFVVDQAKILGEGVGNLEMDFQTDQLDAKLNLVGSMTLRGKAKNAIIVNEGIGNIDASQLITQDMEVMSAGIGKIDVHCEGNLSLKVEGIGKVTYGGNPKTVKKEITGIGKVEAR